MESFFCPLKRVSIIWPRNLPVGPVFTPYCSFMVRDPLFLERLDEIINLFRAHFLAFFRFSVDKCSRSRFRELILRSCGVLQSEKKEGRSISLPEV